MRSMIIRTPMQTGYGGVKHIAVSLSRVVREKYQKTYRACKAPSCAERARR